MADALGHCPGGMADLEAEIPQHVENIFGDAFTPCGLLVRQEKEEIDIGAGCQKIAAITAGGDNGHLLRC